MTDMESKTDFNICLNDHDIMCLQVIIDQWSDAVGFGDEAVAKARCFEEASAKKRLPAVAIRIKRELERALDRPQTHFE